MLLISGDQIIDHVVRGVGKAPGFFRGREMTPSSGSRTKRCFRGSSGTDELSDSSLAFGNFRGLRRVANEHSCFAWELNKRGIGGHGGRVNVPALLGDFPSTLGFLRWILRVG